jgi:hypothetical protein
LLTEVSEFRLKIQLSLWAGTKLTSPLRRSQRFAFKAARKRGLPCTPSQARGGMVFADT